MSAEPIAIRNCGAAAGEAPMVRFKFRCPRTWDSLDPGPDENTRHCGGCQRFVYFCHSPDEAFGRAVSGDCIAVKTTMVERERPGLPSEQATEVGHPEFPEILGEALTDYGPWPDPRPPGNRSPPADL